MFIYKVQSSQSLISHISLSGQYITLWQRANYGCELGLFYKRYQNLFDIVKFNEDARHPIFHSDLKLDHDHIHLVFKKNLTTESFSELIDEIKKQSDLNVRENAYNEYVSELEEIKSKKTDKQFLEFLQNTLSNFDKTTPYFPTEECCKIVKEFEKYFHTRKLSKNIFQDQRESIAHVYYELICSIDSLDEEVAKNIIPTVQKLKQITQFLTFSSYLTTTASIRVIENLINSILQNKAQVREIDALFDREYPIVSLSVALTNLKYDLAEIRRVTQSTWSKRAFNLLALPAAAIGMSLLGLGLWGASILGISTWIAADFVNRNRDWYKFDSYQLFKDSYFKLENKESISLGSQSAGNDYQMFSAIFKPITWAYSREYYGAMVATQLQDTDTLEKRLTVSKQ